MNFGTIVIESLKIMALGMGTVFLGLVLLIFVIELIHKFANNDKKKRNQPEYDKQVNINTANLAHEDDHELIAVISAAIAAMLNISKHDFIVKSIKRLPTTTPKWNSIGRQEQIHSRL